MLKKSFDDRFDSDGASLAPVAQNCTIDFLSELRRAQLTCSVIGTSDLVSGKEVARKLIWHKKVRVFVSQSLVFSSFGQV